MTALRVCKPACLNLDVLLLLLPLLVLQSLFMSMDKDNDGRLSAADLHRAIEQVRAVQRVSLCTFVPPAFGMHGFFTLQDSWNHSQQHGVCDAGCGVGRRGES